MARRAAADAARGPRLAGEALPMETPPHAVGEPATQKQVAVARLVRGLKPLPEGEEPLAIESPRAVPKPAPTPPAVRRARLASRAVSRGAPDDPGVLAVASAPEDPPGEAVAAILGLLRRREEVCLEDWRKVHPDAAPPHLPPMTVGLIVFLVGDVDTGKTAAAARAVAWHRRGALYLRAGALPPPDESLRGVSFDRQEVVSRQRQRALDVDLLVIDEVGTEPDPRAVTEWACLRWPRKATVLLGNTGDKGYWQRYADPRFVSRIKERQDRRVVGDAGGYRIVARDKKMHELPLP